MVPDPYARYLEQADQHFAAGEVVKAGQIWQAILKQSPEHRAARDGLLKVRIWLQAQADEAAAKAEADASPQATQALAPTHPAPPPSPPPAIPEPAPIPVAEPIPEAVAAAAAPIMVAAEAAPDEETQVALPSAPPEASPAPRPNDDELDRMLREGATLYDMGQVEDALKKWEQLLRLDPDHAITREYVEGARRELGLPPLNGGIPAAAPVAPAFEASEVSQDAIEEAEKLLREGCLLWDMGLNEDAIAKWRRALEVAPHRKDIRQFLDDAERETTAATQALNTGEHPSLRPHPTPAPPPPPPPPPPPAVLSPEAEEAVQTKLRQAEHLIGLQRLDEAAYTLQQALRQAPGDRRIQEALARCQSPSASSVSMTSALPPVPPPSPRKPISAPIAVEMDEAAFESSQPGLKSAPEAVKPPEALTRAGSVREGLKLQAPKVLETLQGMPWLRDPKVWAIAAGAILLVSLGGYLIHDWRKDAQLKSDVQAARSQALSQASAEAEVPKLAFTRDAAGAEAQEALTEDPVRAYLLSQYLLKLNPGDTRAAQIRGKALSSLAQGGAAGATLDEFQKHLAEGNLDAAHQVMDALLRFRPDDPDLRTRAARLERALAEDHAAQGHFSEARTDLLRARAFLPEDPSWQAKLRLLDQLRSMSKAQRLAWTPLLG